MILLYSPLLHIWTTTKIDFTSIYLFFVHSTNASPEERSKAKSGVRSIVCTPLVPCNDKNKKHLLFSLSFVDHFPFVYFFFQFSSVSSFCTESIKKQCPLIIIYLLFGIMPFSACSVFCQFVSMDIDKWNHVRALSSIFDLEKRGRSEKPMNKDKSQLHKSI